MLDVHTWWKLGEAYGEDVVRDLVEHAADSGAYWVEEPVEPTDREGYRRLAETGAPLAGGESEETPASLVELGETGSVAFLQGDVRHHEGFTGCLPAIESCRGRDVEFVPHNFGTWSVSSPTPTSSPPRRRSDCSSTPSSRTTRSSTRAGSGHVPLRTVL